MKRAGILVSLMALLCVCAGAERPASTITPEALAARLAAGDAPTVLDVRSEAEYAAGHIPGAILIPHDALASRLSELGSDKDAELVVHCQSGRRAAVAEEILREAGFTHVVDLEGHGAGWKAAGRPTE